MPAGPRPSPSGSAAPVMDPIRSVDLVATLVSDPAAGAVDDAAIAGAAAAIGRPVTATTLAANVAADLAFQGAADDVPAFEAGIRAALAGLPIDVLVQPAASRRKRLLVADMDSTLIGQECIDELAAVAGIAQTVAAITERAMRGEIAFEPALRERVALLAGLDIGVVETVWRERIALTPGAATMVATMRAAGAHVAVVSGGFTVFTERVGRALGVDGHYANRLGVENGRLTGTVVEPILGRDAKRERLHGLARELAISLSATMAVGDGANDLAMIRDAGLGVAYHAKPVVAAEARARVDHGDLTALLYFQGYSGAEFVDG